MDYREIGVLRRTIDARCGRLDITVPLESRYDQSEEEETIGGEEERTSSVEEGGKRQDEALNPGAVLAETRRKYNAREEFVFLLYTDVLEHFVSGWEGRRVVGRPEEKGGLEIALEEEDAAEEDEEEDGRTAGNSTMEDRSWRLRLPDEFAKVKFLSGNDYSGRISRKMMEGEGSYRWRNGARCTGEFERNRVQGNARLELNEDQWYEGEFSDGRPHGKGTMVNRGNRCFYTGEWRDGVKDGNGYCRYAANAGSYEGEWRMDRMNGFGVRIYASGSKYAGEFKHGARHGRGTMVWTNGDVYRGEWKYGIIEGHGEYIWAAFLNKSLAWPRESCYLGEWRNGMRDGKGLLRLNTRGGAKYSGEWKADEKHGAGLILGNNGEAVQADPLFLNDVLVPLSIIDFRKAESERVIAWTNKLMKVTTPVPIPILKPEQLPPLTYHLSRLSRMKVRSFDRENEEKRVYDSLTTHMPRLSKIYNDYANAFASTECGPAACALAMTRFSLWQLWRDTGLNRKGLSLAEIDRCIGRNKDARLEESAEDPFERLEIWQFVHGLLEVSWLFYKTLDEDAETSSGILAAGLNRLLKLDVYPNAGNRVGKLCNGYIDVLPIYCVLDFYRDIGRPVFARDLLCGGRLLQDPFNLTASIYRTSSPGLPTHLPNARMNARIAARKRISYIPRNEQERFPTSQKLNLTKDQLDRRVNGLLAFRDLSVEKMTGVIGKVCPSIRDEETGLIVRMDYELTFLEFYEILVEATIEQLSETHAKGPRDQEKDD